MHIFLYFQANVIIAFVWGLSLMFAIFPLVGWNQYVSEVRIYQG